MPQLFALLVGILFVFSPQAEEHREVAAPTLEEAQELIVTVQDIVEYYYVDQVDRRAMIEGALKGLFESLDPHSTYLTPQTLELLREANDGHYYGYGIEVSIDEGVVQVITPLAHSSAHYAGIKPGDILVRVDDLPATPDTMDKLIQYIKTASREDRTLTLTLKREKAPMPLTVSLQPSNITIDSTQFRSLPHQVGYLKINSFNRQTTDEVARFSSRIRQEGLTQLILDLRNNPGGMFDSAVQIADMFLDAGLIVSTHGRFLDANNDYYASDAAPLGQLEVVVLINEGSASAAEILAGALKDHQKATLFGQTSFGKGTVQSLIPLLGQQGAIKLTTARYATPNGTFIDKKGIDPDIQVLLENSVEKPIMAESEMNGQWLQDSQLAAAYEWLLQPSRE
ncbi:S41 family peptidase [Ferrimonas sp. YFM]|uniref:S41 family peptidase n=1 Tax=Ferrimonas sp. YFM TaxID=3028878 RepID=UPI0025746315|nr:S41 family peptidase [Ferrimonas sp. YFM]BDY07049.1 carboxyl-terminal processing protease [Ferrimonas sp. YFM]